METGGKPNDAPSLVSYQVVGARRLQWDSLLWQVPTLSLTGQAFLLVIALGESSTDLARYMSAGLGLLMAFTSLLTLASHRTTEVSDAHWMHALEGQLGITPVSGPAFKANRDSYREAMKNAPAPEHLSGLRLFFYRLPDRIVRMASRRRAYPVWIYTFIAFGIVQLTVILVTAFRPALL